MAWFKVDDKFHDHPKARRAGLAACGLWLRAGSWSADQLTDGFVPDDVLPRWSGRGVDVFALADVLVDARLWERDESGPEAGYRFRKWSKYQPTRAEVKGKRSAESDGGALGNHVRWHVNRDVLDPSCSYCIAPESGTRSHPESPESVGPDSSRPVPTRPDPVPSSVTRGDHAQHVDNSGLTDDDLDKIATKTNGDRDHARRVAADILDRAAETPRRPRAYVLRAITAEPERYRKARRLTPDNECPTHTGQFADTCSGCAADRKAAK